MEQNIEDIKENQQNTNEVDNIENNECNNEANNEGNTDKYNLELEEDEINKEDIKDIVDYLSNLDYEKYSRDMEIKEALMILKTKMDKMQEEKEKEEENEKIKVIEDNNLTIYNNQNNENGNGNKTEIINEQNINAMTNKEENTGILNNNIKEPKKIIDEEEIKKKEKIEKFKMAEKIAKSSQLKDVHSVQSVQKLLLRENYDEQAPLKITIIKENPLSSCDGYIPNKLPFLRSLPLV